MTSGVRGVLIDFAGTLFDQEPEHESLRAIGVPDAEWPDVTLAFSRSEYLAAGLGRLPNGLAEQWARRDLSAAEHRGAYLGLFELAGVPGALAEAYYERAISVAAWRPYADTARALGDLRSLGLPVAVVSNIAWDVRPIFARDGLLDLVDEFVLSFERGAMKPDSALFTLACDALGVPPSATLMIGDSVGSDGGAVAIGCRFVHVGSPRTDDALLRAVAGLTSAS